MTGETIGQYRIEEKLGEGGVGEVYRAVDVVLGREVALKRLRPELARRSDVVERFRSEACTLAQLNHPNIATLHQLDRDGDDWFMVMEYIEGATVSALLQREGRLPTTQALRIFAQALDGLGYAHERGIVHRDIKGSNLIVTRRGLVKIMDFGIARVLGAERLTMMGHPVGTPEYMAPEQIRGDEIDGRTDIYALGSLLYALLSGETPFRGGSDYELMRAQIESEPPPLSGRVEGLPEGLAQAALRALAKEPSERFASTREFREALSPWLGDAEGAGPDVLRATALPVAAAAGGVDARPSAGTLPADEITRVLSEGGDPVPMRPPPRPPPARGSVFERTTRTLVGPARRRAGPRAALQAVGLVALLAGLLAGTNWLRAPRAAGPTAIAAGRLGGPTAGDPASVAAAPGIVAGADAGGLSDEADADAAAEVAKRLAPPAPGPPAKPPRRVASAHSAAPSPKGKAARSSAARRPAQPRAVSAEEKSTPEPAMQGPPTRAGASDAASAAARDPGEDQRGWVIRRH